MLGVAGQRWTAHVAGWPQPEALRIGHRMGTGVTGWPLQTEADTSLTEADTSLTEASDQIGSEAQQRRKSIWHFWLAHTGSRPQRGEHQTNKVGTEHGSSGDKSFPKGA